MSSPAPSATVGDFLNRGLSDLESVGRTGAKAASTIGHVQLLVAMTVALIIAMVLLYYAATGGIKGADMTSDGSPTTSTVVGPAPLLFGSALAFLAAGVAYRFSQSKAAETVVGAETIWKAL